MKCLKDSVGQFLSDENDFDGDMYRLSFFILVIAMNTSRVNLRNFVLQWYGFIIKRHFKGVMKNFSAKKLNPLNPELNPICYLLALLGAHHFLHVSRIRVKLLTLRRIMSYIYGAPILDVSRSHTTTQHSR